MYISKGSGDDWLRGEVGLKWIYLLELPDKEFGFLLPESEIPKTVNSVFNGIRAGALTIASTYYRFSARRGIAHNQRKQQPLKTPNAH